MFSGVIALLSDAGASLWIATKILALSAVAFALLGLLVKGLKAVEAARRATREVSVNLSLFFLDGLFVAPLAAVGVQIIRVTVSGSPFELVHPQAWSALPVPLTAFLVLFAGDFISYWRHRMEHTRLLWPSHAIHHSDTEMTWLTLNRFHPINRLTTMIVDTTFLAVAGFPEWALVLNIMVRNYYGQFIHADLPWTYGSVGRLIVSPVMHRWHHARDVTGAGSNFATVFSVFDQVFGTYYVPGLCNVPLGVNDEMGKGTIGQLVYPFVEWGSRIANRIRQSRQCKAAPLDHKPGVSAGR